MFSNCNISDTRTWNLSVSIRLTVRKIWMWTNPSNSCYWPLQYLSKNRLYMLISGTVNSILSLQLKESTILIKKKFQFLLTRKKIKFYHNFTVDITTAVAQHYLTDWTKRFIPQILWCRIKIRSSHYKSVYPFHLLIYFFSWLHQIILFLYVYIFG